MLTQADIDAAVSESLAKTQELLSEYGEQFVRPMVEVQKRMQDARIMMQGGEDGQRTTGTTDDDTTDDAEASAGL